MAARPKLDRWELTYGEFSIPVLFDLINTLPKFDQVKFYDIGSGAGKSALAVKLYRPEWHVTGIEYLPELHEIAIKHGQGHPGLHFVCGDFLQHDFNDGNVVMINATAFNGDIWDQLHEKVLNVPTGTFVIITSKPLSETSFKKHYEGLHEMSWGFTSTYIYEKM
jgi:SAM-dependent methyltransferase